MLTPAQSLPMTPSGSNFLAMYPAAMFPIAPVGRTMSTGRSVTGTS